jgi:hypothetical protein
MRFRHGVYANRTRLTAGCQILLLRMSDDMNHNCIVSVPRATLATDLNAPESRISEWVKQAKDAGFLSVVKPAKRGRTAVYQGLIGVRPGVPQQRDEWGTDSRTPSGYAPAYPNGGEWGTPSTPPTEVVTNEAIDTNTVDHLHERRHDEGQGVHAPPALDERSA